MNKIDEIQEHHLSSCIESEVTHSIECGCCGEGTAEEYDGGEDGTAMEFVRSLIDKEEIIYASSEMFGMIGPVCEKCFNDEEYDFIKIEKL